jgi:hypothetical protein
MAGASPPAQCFVINVGDSTTPAVVIRAGAVGGADLVLRYASGGSDITFPIAVPVTSVFTRTGDIVANAADYSGIYLTGNQVITLSGDATGNGATTITVTVTGVTGTVAGGDAAAGHVGEFVTASLASGSAVGLSVNVVASVTSVSLTAGDWDVSGIVGFKHTATTAITALLAAISTSSTGYSEPDYSGLSFATFTPTNSSYINTLVTPVKRISISATTTIYLVCSAVFATSTLNAFGAIRARRVR